MLKLFHSLYMSIFLFKYKVSWSSLFVPYIWVLLACIPYIEVLAFHFYFLAKCNHQNFFGTVNEWIIKLSIYIYIYTYLGFSFLIHRSFWYFIRIHRSFWKINILIWYIYGKFKNEILLSTLTTRPLRCKNFPIVSSV